LLLPKEKVLYERLDLGNHTLAALNFCHILLKLDDSVAEFISKGFSSLGLEKIICEDTRDILHGKLPAGWIVVHIVEITIWCSLQLREKRGGYLSGNSSI